MIECCLRNKYFGKNIQIQLNTLISTKNKNLVREIVKIIVCRGKILSEKKITPVSLLLNITLIYCLKKD
jgi:hypothetical protein